MLICQYCGHEWKLELYAYQLNGITCPTCNDKNIKKKAIENSDVFGYNVTDKKPDAYIGNDDD